MLARCLLLACLLLAGCESVENSFVRDGRRVYRENESQVAFRVYHAIMAGFGAEHDGKLPPADWSVILRHVQGPRPSKNFLAKTIYNDIYAEQSEVKENDIPLLIVFRPDGTARNLVLLYSGQERWLTDKELCELEPVLSPQAHHLVKKWLQSDNDSSPK